LDFLNDIERITAFAVQFIDEGNNRNISKAADFEEFQRLRLNPFGDIQHHDGAIRRGEGAVGVFREVLMAGRIE